MPAASSLTAAPVKVNVGQAGRVFHGEGNRVYLE